MINVLLRHGQSVWDIAFSLFFRVTETMTRMYFTYFSTQWQHLWWNFLLISQDYTFTQRKDTELHPHTATYPLHSLSCILSLTFSISPQWRSSRNIPHFLQTSVKCQTVGYMLTHKWRQERADYCAASNAGPQLTWYVRLCAFFCTYVVIFTSETWHVCQQNNASFCVWLHSFMHMCEHVCAWQKGLRGPKVGQHPLEYTVPNTLREKHARWCCGEHSHFSFYSCRTIQWQHLDTSAYGIKVGLCIKLKLFL